MKITIFTSNQPRHLSLIESLASIASEVYAVIETSTIFPGQVADFYKRSGVMQRYFSYVIAAERQIFGIPRPLPKNVHTFVLKIGDLNWLQPPMLDTCLKSNQYIVFGSSYIKGPLADFLISRKAINIHMGTSPYYRGSSCNFWACYDKNFDFVGATIHFLSPGLDSGDILFHAFPPMIGDAFLLGMSAVKSAQHGLIEYLKRDTLKSLGPVKQDKRLQLRYTRHSEFNDEMAQSYLDNLPSADQVVCTLKKRDLSQFVRPHHLVEG